MTTTRETMKRAIMAMALLIVMTGQPVLAQTGGTIYAKPHRGHWDVLVLERNGQSFEAEFDTIADVRRYARARRMSLLIMQRATTRARRR